MLRALDFGSGFATHWRATLDKAFDITELFFLYLEIDESNC